MKLKKERNKIKELTCLELSRIKIKLYNEFYEKNKELYKKDVVMYHHKAFNFVEKELRKIMYVIIK